jgi:preprotein translocase subunit SecG
MVVYYLFSTLYVLFCLMLLMVILLQQGKGDMAAAFGGGSSQSAFGARAGATVLSKATAILAVLFMVGALALAIMGQRGPGSLVSGAAAPRSAAPAPKTPAAPAQKAPAAPPAAPTAPAKPPQ